MLVKRDPTLKIIEETKNRNPNQFFDEEVQILFNDELNKILEGSPRLNQISQNIDQTPLIFAEKTPMMSSLNTPCSTVDKK